MVGEVPQKATASSDGISETTGTPARGTKFYVAQYCQEDQLVRVTQNNNIELSLLDICNAHFLCLVGFIRLYGFDHAKGTIFVTIIALVARFEACESAPSRTPCVLDETGSMVLLDQRHRH